MNAKNVRQLIVDRALRFGYKNAQQFQFLFNTLEKADQASLLDGILAIFLEDASSVDFVEQELAGRLLMQIKPPAHFELMPFLRNALVKYELSVEQLPWYLVDQFSEPFVLKALAELRLELTDRKEISKLNAMEFWLKAARE